MTNPLQIEFERQLKEFENKWQDPMEKKYGDGFKLFCSFCQGEWRDQIKDFMVSCQQSTVKKMIEMVEKEKLTCNKHNNLSWITCDICDDCIVFNSKIDDILSELNKAI